MPVSSGRYGEYVKPEFLNPLELAAAGVFSPPILDVDQLQISL
jgi:hypothetical protein